MRPQGPPSTRRVVAARASPGATRSGRPRSFIASEAGTEARDVLDYLRRRHGQLPRAVTEATARDELILSAWVYWDERRRERELLKRTLRAGSSLAQVGAFLGIRTRQGVRDYLDRLDALLAENARTVRERPRSVRLVHAQT